MINVKDLRLQGDLIDLLVQLLSRQEPPTPDEDETPLNVITRPGKLPRWLRFFMLKFSNISFMQLGNGNVNCKAECLLHTTMKELIIGFRGSDKTFFSFSCVSSGLCANLLKHGTEETSLAHLSFNWKMNAYYDSDAHFVNASLDVDQPQINLHEGLSNISSDLLWLIKSSQKNEFNLKNETQFTSRLIKVLRKVPSSRIVAKFNNCAVKFVREGGQKALTLSMDLFNLDVAKSANELELRMLYQNFNLAFGDKSSSHNPIANLKRLNTVCKIENESSFHNCLNVIFLYEIVSCHVSYNQLEMDYWINLIKNEIDVEDQSKQSEKKSSIVQKLLNQSSPYLKISTAIELSDITLTVNGSQEDLSLFCCFRYSKFNFSVNPDPLFKEMG